MCFPALKLNALRVGRDCLDGRWPTIFRRYTLYLFTTLYSRLIELVDSLYGMNYNNGNGRMLTSSPNAAVANRVPVNPGLWPTNWMGSPPYYNFQAPSPWDNQQQQAMFQQYMQRLNAPQQQQQPYNWQQHNWDNQMESKKTTAAPKKMPIMRPKKSPFEVVPSYKFGKYIKDTTSSTTTSSTTDSTKARVDIIKIVKKKPDCCAKKGLAALGIAELGGLPNIAGLGLQKSRDTSFHPKMVAHLTNKAVQEQIAKNVQRIVQVNPEYPDSGPAGPHLASVNNSGKSAEEIATNLGYKK